MNDEPTILEWTRHVHGFGAVRYAAESAIGRFRIEREHGTLVVSFAPVRPAGAKSSTGSWTRWRHLGTAKTVAEAKAIAEAKAKGAS